MRDDGRLEKHGVHCHPYLGAFAPEAALARGTRARDNGNMSQTADVPAPDAMPLSDVRHFLEALARARPDARSELDYTDPFTLLIAVVLSAQTTDVGVNRVTPALFQAAPTPEAMARLGVDGVGRHIRTLGLWQGKARNVVELSRLLVERHGGVVPRDRAALEALPGVGRKTANVLLNVAFGEPTMAVDTHVFRLGNRTGIAPGKTPREVEDALVSRIPPDLLRAAHHLLILHGRYVCKARLPECWHCVAAPWCRYPNKTPAPGAAVKRTPSGSARSPRSRAPRPE
jgi:endonuclease III